MSPAAGAGPGGEREFGASLVGQWAVCAIAAGASRFIPVPLLDDAVKQRSTRIAVLVTVRDAGRTLPADAVAPLWDGVENWMDGVRKYARAVPRKVVLFPVRKYVELFGAVRGVPQDVMQVMLLARTTHRCLERGLLPDPDPAAPAGFSLGGRLAARAGRKAGKESVQAESARIRRAFDTAVAGMDLSLLAGALADALSQGKGLSAAAVAYASRAFTRPVEPGEDDAVGRVTVPRPGAAVEEGAERVERVWSSPEVARLLREFDARFDAALAGPAIGPGSAG
jgi:hypothetical protein